MTYLCSVFNGKNLSVSTIKHEKCGKRAFPAVKASLWEHASLQRISPWSFPRGEGCKEGRRSRAHSLYGCEKYPGYYKITTSSVYPKLLVVLCQLLLLLPPYRNKSTDLLKDCSMWAEVAPKNPKIKMEWGNHPKKHIWTKQQQNPSKWKKA